MLFNSLEYLFLFLPTTLVLFLVIALRAGIERQILWLVAASLVFYASWEPIYLLLILASIVVNFTLGRTLASTANGSRRLWLTVGVGFNLGLLGYFKYTGFFLEGLNALGLWLIPIPEITLPLAISFFTFQQIAYLVDVARNDCEEYQFSHYALFVLFFPQLIAGPIVHHKELMPQFRGRRPRAELPTDLSIGLTFIAIGLFKKVVMADSLAMIADPVHAAASAGRDIHTLDALAATFAFSFQIYFDFSGYSDMAIGSARLFGIRLPENFRSPYKSRSAIEMWKRWHITLSRFLRDYLYISLGGNRHGSLLRYRNLLLTMLLGGLWHGAAWTFVLWGALHGAYLCINHAWRGLLKGTRLQAVFAAPVFTPVYIALTFTCWSVAMIFFRASDMNSSWRILDAAFLGFRDAPEQALSGVFDASLLHQLTLAGGLGSPALAGVWLCLLAAALICWCLPNAQEFMVNCKTVLPADNRAIARPWLRWRPNVTFAILTGLVLGLSIMGMSHITRFIYFQF